MCWCTPTKRTPYCDSYPWKMADEIHKLKEKVSEYNDTYAHVVRRGVLMGRERVLRGLR